MRKTDTITINDKVITVNELTVRQIMTLKDMLSARDMLDGMQELIGQLTDAAPEFLLELAPSELRALYEKVKEVNADFFEWTRLEELLAGYRKVVMELVTRSLSGRSAGSSPPDMDQPSGITA